MPTRAVKRFDAWSYSRLHDYDECPARAKYQHLDKLPKGPEGPALLKGQAAHKDGELYATGRLKKLPPSLELFAEEFNDLRKCKRILQVEQQLALDDTWKPSDWFGPHAWLRAVLDVCYVEDNRLIINDYKTGKVRPENMPQLDLYAVVGFAHHPAVEAVDAAFWYLDAGEVNARSYVPADVPKLKAMWAKRTRKMLADTTFKPTPGHACRFCPYTHARGGPCKY
jgi:hypothetical protein